MANETGKNVVLKSDTKLDVENGEIADPDAVETAVTFVIANPSADEPRGTRTTSTCGNTSL